MAAQPTEDQIEQVLSLTDNVLSRQEAIQRLKGNNNNADQALNEYFDDPVGSSNKYRWDETQFTDRDGMTNNHGIAFDIQGPDDPGPYPRYDGAGAPSRPPSRTSNNKSPLSKVIDLTAEHAAADPSMSMSFDHDADLHKALEQSRVEAGMAPQETGITSTDKVYFGPATRPQNEYESGQWGLVPLGKSALQEILLDPEPALRKRGADAPAFLKPSAKNHRLGALITIYHEIPVTRNLFLNIQDAEVQFGYNKEWWTGKQIEMNGIAEEELPTHLTVDRELQRLMAFLDKTERSYASVEALANHPEVQKTLGKKGDSNIEAAVLDTWKQKFEGTKPAMVKQIFSTGVDSEKKEVVQNFAILELVLPAKGSMQETFYDMADEILWHDLQPFEITESPYLSHIAEVIAFQVEGGEERKSVDIPLAWYPDRYLEGAKQAALDMRLRKKDVQEELNRIDRIEDQLTHVALKTGKIVKVQDLLKASLKHDSSEIKGGDSGHNDDMLSDERCPSPAALKLSSDLMKLVASIDKKLLALNEEKEKARQTFRELSKLYTEPSNEPNAPKLHKYTLRGVSTTKSTMYICRRAEADLIDMVVDGDEPKGPRDQWWRINYATTGDDPVTVEKTTRGKVLEAAKENNKNTLLVYASEKAMNNYPPHALPKNLESFVKWENTNFKSELRTVEEVQTDPQIIVDDAQPVGLSSPGKRKFHESSFYNQEYGVEVSERELHNSDGSSDWESGPSNDPFKPRKESVIVGIDPSLLTRDHDGIDRRQEMQERNGIPMLSGRPLTKEKASTIDSMDLDQVIEDADVKEESAAVKHVGFVE